VSGQVRSLSLRLILFATLFLNLASMLLTYERTFWVTTILGLVFVVIKGSRMQRGRALIGIPLTAAILLSVMATIAPAELTAARERLLSIGQYANDDSVRERIVETRHVLAKIDAHPFVGSGLGDTVFWGRPWQQVPPKAGWYAHNGYLWVAWKLGLLAALLLFALLAWAVFSRGPPVGGPLFRSLRTGSQAALLVLLLSSITFPSFNAVSITATMGVLAAVSLAPRREAVGETADSTAIRGPV
jgi:O-antigen ligase